MRPHITAVLLLSLMAWPLHAEISATLVHASRPMLSNPHDLKLAPNGDYLFVSDVGNNRIAILDPETLDLIDSFGEDHQSGTHDIDFDTMGLAYIADTHNNRVIIYMVSGTNARSSGTLIK
ncbi:MAG: hypothetical protein ABW139_12230 [Candidatus Thiodiazotropha sp. DIVDIV]